MTSLRACIVLLLLGFAAPVGLVALTQPALADDGGDSDSDESDQDEAEERGAAQPGAPEIDFSTLSVGQPPATLDIHSTFRGGGC